MKKSISMLLTFTMLFTMFTSFGIVTTNAAASHEVDKIVWTQDFEKNMDADDSSTIWTANSNPYFKGGRFAAASSGSAQFKDEADNNYLSVCPSQVKDAAQDSAVKVYLDNTVFEVGKKYKVSAEVELNLNSTAEEGETRNVFAYLLSNTGYVTLANSQGTTIPYLDGGKGIVETKVFEYTQDMKDVANTKDEENSTDKNTFYHSLNLRVQSAMFGKVDGDKDRFLVDNVRIIEVTDTENVVPEGEGSVFDDYVLGSVMDFEDLEYNTLRHSTSTEGRDTDANGVKYIVDDPTGTDNKVLRTPYVLDKVAVGTNATRTELIGILANANNTAGKTYTISFKMFPYGRSNVPITVGLKHNISVTAYGVMAVPTHLVEGTDFTPNQWNNIQIDVTTAFDDEINFSLHQRSLNNSAAMDFEKYDYYQYIYIDDIKIIEKGKDNSGNNDNENSGNDDSGNDDSTEEGDIFTYTVSNGKVTITDFSESYEGELIIPDTLGGYPVTSIGTRAFLNCTGITSIILPEGITNIENAAFYGCTGLASIKLHDSITTIGASAFYNCTNLKTVYYMGLRTDWQKVEIGNNNECLLNASLNFGEVGPEDIFTYSISNEEATITGLSDKDYSGKLIIPSVIDGYPVTKIGYDAFENCTNLTSVTIPDSVTSIASSAFYGCTGLTSVTIPDSVTSIGRYAFQNCTGLTSVTIPDSVTSIGDYAFENCTGLTSIKVGENNQNYSSEDGVLYNKNKTELLCYPAEKKDLTSFTVPDSVITIRRNAFANCTGLTSISIPSSVAYLEGYHYFWCCTNLTSIIVDEDNQNYSSEDGVLYNKNKTILLHYPAGKKDLTSFTVPDSVTKIYAAFESCTGLKDLIISDNVTEIGDHVFKNSKIENIFIGSGVKQIGECILVDSEVKWINVDENNQHFSSENGVLYNKDKTWLICYPPEKTNSAFAIPESVSNVWECAFFNVHLKTLIIPRGVESIFGAFQSYWNLLNNIYYTGSLSDWEKIYDADCYPPDEKVFFNCQLLNDTYDTYYDDDKNTNTQTFRFFNIINSLDYAEIGFEIEANVDGNTYNWNVPLYEVYKNVNVNELNYITNDTDEEKYILTGAIGDVPNYYFIEEFVAKAYTIDYEGNKTYLN